VGLQAGQLGRERSYPIDVKAGPTNVYSHVPAIGPTQARKRLRERGIPKLHLRSIFVGLLGGPGYLYSASEPDCLAGAGGFEPPNETLKKATRADWNGGSLDRKNEGNWPLVHRNRLSSADDAARGN
jgi:hypothetical protein